MNIQSLPRRAPSNDIYADLFIAHDLVHDHAPLGEILSNVPRPGPRPPFAVAASPSTPASVIASASSSPPSRPRARARLSLAIARRASRRRGRRARQGLREARAIAPARVLGRAGDATVGEDAWEIGAPAGRSTCRASARACGDERTTSVDVDAGAGTLGMIRLA